NVVGAFHNLAADRLANLDVDLDLDTIVVGDDPDAKDIVRMLAEEIEGLRALDAGGVANAPEVESLTPLLVNIATNNDGMHDVGVTFH
ncbi:NADPH-dependent F420 reductase, partial [Halobium palmae]